MDNSARKEAQPKPKRPDHSGHKGGSRDPQPEHLEEFYIALRKGLNDYLEVCQNKRHKLMSWMDNSQGDLSDLDKQIKTIEGYMTRLEIQIKKADALYEDFCNQRRLRDGASRMKQAFAFGPTTRGTKKNIAKVDRQYKEYIENMAALTSQLENLLGEFHIKMRGFRGFIRLFGEDEYKMSLQYGGQKFRLKGKIGWDIRQTWEEETMIFKALVSDPVNIKVTELRGLRGDALSGRVRFDTKNLFTARPLLGTVDVTYPKINVNLEVTWHPFGDDLIPLVSLHSQGTPETPTFEDTSFFSTLPDDVLNGGCGVAECPTEGRGRLAEAILSLLKLEASTDCYQEMQDLEQEVRRLEDLLKCRLPGHSSSSSSLSPSVKSALACFDFLYTLDLDDEDTGDDTLESIGVQHPDARGHLSEAPTEDTGVGTSVAGSPLPLTTGNESLDVAIVIHLQYCIHLIQMLISGVGRWKRCSLLQKLSGQTQLLKALADVIGDRQGAITSVADVLPVLAERPALMALWSQCSGSAGLFHTSLDRVYKHMNQCYTAVLQDKHPHSSDTVIGVVVGEMMDRSDLVTSQKPPSSVLSQDVLTVFDFHSYIVQHEVQDMETHLLHVAREGLFAEALCSGDYSRCLAELEEVPVSSLWPRNTTLRALASLLTVSDPQVSKAAADYLSSAASHSNFMTRAVEYYTQALSEAGDQTQRAVSSALSCLRAVESIMAVVEQCDSADEELRHVAIETALTFGEEGRLDLV